MSKNKKETKNGMNHLMNVVIKYFQNASWRRSGFFPQMGQGAEVVCDFLRFTVSTGIDFDLDDNRLCHTAELAYSTELEQFHRHRQSQAPFLDLIQSDYDVNTEDNLEQARLKATKFMQAELAKIAAKSGNYAPDQFCKGEQLAATQASQADQCEDESQEMEAAEQDGSQASDQYEAGRQAPDQFEDESQEMERAGQAAESP